MSVELDKFITDLNNLVAAHQDLDGREVQKGMRVVLEGFYTDFEPMYSAGDILKLIGKGISESFLEQLKEKDHEPRYTHQQR